MSDILRNRLVSGVLCPAAMETAVFYVTPNANQGYSVIATNASRSGCVATYSTEEEAERQCDLMNRMSGADEEIEDVPEVMFELLDQLR